LKLKSVVSIISPGSPAVVSEVSVEDIAGGELEEADIAETEKGSREMSRLEKKNNEEKD